MKKLFLLFFLITHITFSQSINWSDISSQYNLPDGVKLFKGERTSPILKVFYYEVDLTNPNIAVRPYITSSPANLRVLTERFGAYGAINGGFFGGSTSYSSVVYPNEVKAQNVGALSRNSLSYPILRSFFGIRTDLSMSVDWIYHYGGAVNDIYVFDNPMNYVSNDPNPKPVPDKISGTQYENLLVGIGGAPTLVKDGIARVTYNEEIMWGSGVGLSNNDPRTAVGFTNNSKVIMLVADGRTPASQGVSLTELAQIMISLGCVEAMNLDGGGSSQITFGNQYINASPESRSIPTILAIVHRDSLGLSKEPLFEKIIDTEDAEQIGIGWFETANAGFYGNTKSLLSPIGTGERAMKYNLDLHAEAVYEVYGWWVSSSNRCTNTPYIISHQNGIDTVRVDQTKDGSAWVKLGTYTFSTDSNNFVMITDQGKLGNYVVADAIKIISYDPAVVTDVEEEQNMITEYKLYQNYPNPFNPSTTITFSLPQNSKVSLKVYDILGNLITTLLNDEKAEGFHKIKFNSANLSSGIYFYKLEAGNYMKTEKMIILK